MNWVLLALLAPAVYTLNNFIDKYLVSNRIKDYRAIFIYSAIVGLGAGSLIWLLTGMPIFDRFDASIVLLTGMLTVWGLPLYFKALAEEETTTIIILFQTIPIISLILAFFILGETITVQQILGFILIFICATLATLKKTKGKIFQISPAFFYVLLFNFMWALAGVLIKFTINATSFTKILPYESWGIGIGGLVLFILFPGIRKAFLKSLKTLKKPTIGIVVSNEVVFVTAKAVTFLAYSLGPVALVSVLGGTQVFFGIIYGTILTILFPKLFKEDIDKNTLIKKGILGLGVLIGIILMS